MALADDADNPHEELPATRSRGFITVLWRRKALVILGAIIGLVGGSLVYWQRPPVYQSATQILVIKKRSDAALPIAGGDPRLAYVEDYMSTHVVLMRSPLIVERAVKKKDLMSLKTFENSHDPIGQVLGSLTVARDSKEAADGANNIIRLSYRGPVAEDCGKILDAMIESYQEFLNVSYKNVSDETFKLITAARDVLKNDLAEAEEKYQKFRERTPLVSKNKDGVNIHMERVGTLESKRSTLMIRQTELRERVKLLEKAMADGKGAEDIISLPLLTTDGKQFDPEKALEDQLLPLLLQENQLLETYGEEHPQVLSVRNRIAFVRGYHGKTSGMDAGKDGKNPLHRPLQLLRSEIRENELVMASLGKVLDELKAESKDVSNYEVQEDRLRNDITRTHQLYEGTIKRLAEISLVRDSGGFDAKPLSQSGVGYKIAPSAFQIVTGGLLFGILAGIGLAYLADFTDKGFRNADELRRRLGLPILGHVPFLKPDSEVTRKIEAGEFIGDPLLCTLFKPKSLEAEAYRAVRTALYFSTQGEGHRVIQFSSPGKSDGKSLTVSNVAISMARSGKKVLIIDADCRRPRQNRIFDLKNTHGLANVIAQDMPWGEGVQATCVEGLSLLPSGPVPPNPSELLSSPKFAALLTAVRPEFDYILVDTPPLLAVTDPCVVAGHVDGVVLVLRLARQGRPQAERAREILVSLGVKIVGVVVNGVSRQVGGSIYSSENYEYAESYTQDEKSGKYDAGYYDYYQEPEGADQVPTNHSPSESNGSAR